MTDKPRFRYYYDEDNKSFYNYSDKKKVSRKLCFICGKMQDRNTDIIGEKWIGYAQICTECRKDSTF